MVVEMDEGKQGKDHGGVLILVLVEDGRGESLMYQKLFDLVS